MFSCPPPPLEQNTIGRYDIIYPLASGGMATIYVGRLSGMAGFEKFVTLKLIHSHLVTQRQFVEMFLDEARLAAMIHHPNVGEIYEVVEDNGQLFMAAEFVDGLSLSHLIRAAQEQRKPISHPVAAWICAEVCQGLQVVHDLTDDDGCPLNLVHRDVSPSNIMLSYSGWVKLIDFGIAFAENRLTHTMPGNVKGKIGYISPEQLKGATLDRRADIFSTGVILYKLVTGQHPFSGNTDVERLRKTLQYELVTPSELPVAIDSVLEAIILKAMARSPDNRYQKASSLERDLRRYIAATREVTGASDVARLMQTLFANRKTLHQERLAEFKHNTPVSPRVHRTGESAILSALSKRDEADAASPAVSVKRHKGGPGFSGRDLALFAIIGGVIASVLIVGVFYLFSTKSRKLPPRQPDEAAVLENHVPVWKPAVDLSKENNPSGKEDAHNIGAKKGGEAPEASELVEIPVTLQPAETELLLNGDVLKVEANSIKLPGDGQSYAIIAKALGYITETYAVVAKTGETLSVALSPSRPPLSNHSKEVRKSNRRDPNGKKTGNKSNKVLKRNPY